MHRTARRLLLPFCLLLAAGVASASPQKVPRLIFPVVGDMQYRDDFGEPRGQGKHEGNDIVAARKAPAVAVEGGKVSFWTTSQNAGCMLYLHGDSGTTYLYIHLNNDLTAKNDNRGACKAGVAYAPKLKDGARVEAGQLVGFVGDSGDADGIHPHLHFEVHPNGGKAVSPYPHLRRAQRLLFYAKPGTTFTLTLNGSIVSNENGVLAFKVTSLNVWPSKQKLTLTRKLLLALAPDAKIELAPGGPIIGTLSPSLRAGASATVWTAPAPVTIAAERGDDAALVAARIVLASP